MVLSIMFSRLCGNVAAGSGEATEGLGGEGSGWEGRGQGGGGGGGLSPHCPPGPLTRFVQNQ